MTRVEGAPNAPVQYKAKDVARAFERIAPLESGIQGDELGFIYGSPEARVTGVGCLWNVHSKSLDLAVENRLEMLICHETLWMAPQTSPWYDGPAEDQIKPNQMRRKLLEEHGMVVYRSHSNWDVLPEHGVPDQAVAALGIPHLEVFAEQKYFKVHQLPEPMTVKELKVRAEKGLKFGACRVFGDPTLQVSRFSFLIGGFGGNQRHMPQAALDMGAEAIIIGEMDEFILIGALELGMPVIETLHSASESPAIRRQAQILAQHLPGLKVMYILSGAQAFAEGQHRSEYLL